MHITLRLICEKFRRIAVKMSFLWGNKYGVYTAPSVSASVHVTPWCLRNNMQHFTFVISCMNMVFIAGWLSGGNSEILQYSDVFTCRQKLCKPQSFFKQARVNFFYLENMTSFLNYVAAMLTALYAWRGSNFEIWLPGEIWFFALLYVFARMTWNLKHFQNTDISVIFIGY